MCFFLNRSLSTMSFILQKFMYAGTYNQMLPINFSSSLSLDSLIEESPAPEENQPSSISFYEKISSQWKGACREALSDLRSIGWARAGLWTLFVVWTMAMLGCLIYLIQYGLDSSIANGTQSACSADGNFHLFITEYSSWAASGFFEITLGFGNLSFTQAKVIDIAWDIIIGRSGQALMAYLSWRAFADYVTTSMETMPVTYAVYFIVFIQDEPSLISMFRLIRAFIHGRVLKSRISMIFMILSIAFLLAWPTLASAMSGYTTIGKAFVTNYDGSYIPFSEFQPIAYMIHDGWRVNLTGDYAVSYSSSQAPKVDPYFLSDGSFNYFGGCSVYYPVPGCDLQIATSDYVSLYGFFGLNNTASVWMNTSIPSPALNISAFYLTPDFIYSNFNWTDPGSTAAKQSYTNSSNLAFTSYNQTYSLAYIHNNGRCQPAQDRFQWGFSFIQLFIVVICLAIWTIGTYLMWLKARFQLPLRGQAEVPKGWRSALILVERMSKELQEADIDPHSLTDRQLKKEIYQRLQGGSVSFDIPLTRSGYSFRQATKNWLKKELRWFISFLIVTFGVSPGLICGALALPSLFSWPILYLFIILSVSLIVGILFAMIVGSTRRGRLLMVMSWWTCGIVVGLAVFAKEYLQVRRFLEDLSTYYYI
ncbi:hypothetical protein GGR54DRAFT_90698 [Hypoxylon sp. NC1633]|nr:hypothetical protein GGR54DRAFT_90698 [Hypoxylon sp. NC1633]